MKNKVILVALLLIFAIPVVLPFLLKSYNFGNKNYGELIEPMHLLKEVQLRDGAVEVNEEIFHDKWSMVVFSRHDCDEACERNLYNIHQVRLTQAKYLSKLTSRWVVSSKINEEQIAKVTERLPDIEVLQINDRQTSWMDEIAKSANNEALDGIYLVDYLGNFFMKYPVDADPSLLKKDLSHLLKIASRVDVYNKES